jgi:hypothetical protein
MFKYLIILIMKIYLVLAVFIFGALATTVLTDILKIMSGRLRPYFLTLCNPDQKSCNGMGRLNKELIN